MGILKYLVQGFGWEIGREAAREGIDAVREAQEPDAPPLTAREQKQLAKAQAQAAERARKERDEAIERNQARIEAELRELKKKVDR